MGVVDLFVARPLKLYMSQECDGGGSSWHRRGLVWTFRDVTALSDGAHGLFFFFFYSFMRPAAFCTRWEEPCQENKTFLQAFM